MGTVERSGDDHTSEVESGEEEEMVGGGELAQHLMSRYVHFCSQPTCRYSRLFTQYCALNLMDYVRTIFCQLVNLIMNSFFIDMDTAALPHMFHFNTGLCLFSLTSRLVEM